MSAKASASLKKYVTLTHDSRGPAAEDLQKRFQVGGYSFMIVDGEGKAVVKYTNAPSQEKVSTAIEGTADFLAGMDALKKVKDKGGSTASNASALAAAVKKIGALESKEAMETIMTYAKDDEAPAELQAAAVGALGRQSDAAKDLAGWLTHKRPGVKTAAAAALKSLGVESIPALLESLASSEVETRVAAHAVAGPLTKNAKFSRDVGFWKNGSEEARGKAISEWKEHYESKLKPKAHDTTPPKK